MELKEETKITKYHGPTNFRGSRIGANDSDGNRVFVSYDSALNSEDNHHAAAQALCRKMGWGGKLIAGAMKNGYCFVFVDEVSK